MADLSVLHWFDQHFVEVRAGIHGATIHGDELTVTVYRYQPQADWEVHEHPEEHVTTVLSGGEIEFTVGGRPVVLAPGHFAIIPGDVPHDAHNGDEEVVTLNVWRLRA
jgi:quercetin dioxygenase-like cupin family protein